MGISVDRVPLRRGLFAAAVLLALVMTLALRAASPGLERAAAATSCPYANASLEQLSLGAIKVSIVCQIREERAESGLSSLTSRRRLRRPGNRHNADMQLNLHYLTHSSSNGDSMTTRIRRYGYMSGANSWAVGEIIGQAWGLGATPRTIMNAWMRSSGHYHVIHTPRYRDFGVAVRRGTARDVNASGALVTVDFGRRSPSL